ncbi:L-threonylcarbamoyladenylate synthase [Carnobacterium divergens]|uniref:L-threonylcarbamoyladenylate synthase n=1 Tax=Carnobacterium divergens TaxID=2748 RepID=UPI0039B0CC98
MKTQRFQKNQITNAADLLKAGELVAFPTETVYGLGADAMNEKAVQQVYLAKGRPSDNPLIVHIAEKKELNDLVEEVPAIAQQLMNRFWPGPLTLIFNAKEGVFAPTVTAGLTSVAIRMPNNSATLELIKKANTPLVGPSANTSGRPSPTTSEHVYHDLNGKIAGILEDGQTGLGLESTVLDITNPEQPMILRPGAITKEEIEKVIGSISIDQHLVGEKETPKAPGMKYTHYSPAEPVIIVDGDNPKWQEAINHYLALGEKVGLLANEERISYFQNQVSAVFSLGEKTNIEDASYYLYAGLRFFENTDATVILAEAYSTSDFGEAYMNRLEKSAGKKYF